MYKRYVKRGIDVFLSALTVVVLLPVWVLISLAIVADDPGPVLFKQKRIARNKKSTVQYFHIYKFRTMKMCTPHDVPTHMLENPEQYITKVGGFLRRTSLDELPQIINILLGQMSIVGPRPALWNQTDLYREREKYAANDLRPGLTGWAQINGRDELEISEKARLDGEYVKRLGFLEDMRCLFLTVVSVLKHEGVVEGGTGRLAAEKLRRKGGGQVEKDSMTNTEG